MGYGLGASERQPFDREAWLEERRRGIGSSDVAAVVGLCQWKTPLHVYLDKRGELEDVENEAMRLGAGLEDAVAGLYGEKYHQPVLWPRTVIERHSVHDYLHASLDRVTICDGIEVPLEVKTAGEKSGWGQEGTDDIPQRYYLQAQHQIFITCSPFAEVAALLGGQGGMELRRYRVHRRPDVQERVLPILQDFWRRVQAGDCPDPAWEHPATAGLLASLYGVNVGLSVKLGEAELDMARRYVAAKAQAKEASEHAEDLKARLLFAMGPAGRAELPEAGWFLTRKEVNRSGFRVEPTTYTMFGVRAGKTKEG